MLDSLFIAATGMNAEQSQIDTIANNLVNLNTMGYKKSNVAFETLMPQPAADMQPASALASTAPSYRGMGVSGTELLMDFAGGTLKQTQNQFDLAIQGEGLFELQMPDGSLAYTRNGAFHVNSDRYLVSADGYPLSANLQIPADAESIVIGSDGLVQAKVQNSSHLTDIGYLEMSHFTNAAGLRPVGNNLYLATDVSGEAVSSRAGQNGTGTIAQGYLEGSNVQMVEELTNMMTAQRAYEANSRVLQASDQILGIINNLRK